MTQDTARGPDTHEGAARGRPRPRLPSRISRAGRGAAGRLSWGLADQAMSSLTSFAVGAVVARSLGGEAFGVFTLAWVTYGVLLNVSRGLATDPLVVRFSGVAVGSWRRAVSRSSGAALTVGVGAGAVSLAVGLALGSAVGSGFTALGLVLPGILLQDSWRYAFFAAGRGGRAFANDAVRGLALVPALAIAAAAGTIFGFVLAWGLAGCVAAGYGCLQLRLRPRPEMVRAWLRQHRDLGSRYLVENVTLSGSSQLWMYGLGAIAGLAAVGAVRGAQLLLGPFMALLMGLAIVAVPEGARVLRRSPGRLPFFCLLLGGVQAVAALAWGLTLMFLLPDVVGRFVLGSVWVAASALVLPVTIGMAGSGLATGAATGLRTLGAARRSLRSELLASAAFVTGGLVGAVLGGALGSCWGAASARMVRVAVWWWQLRTALREHAPDAPDGPDGPDGPAEDPTIDNPADDPPTGDAALADDESRIA